MQTLKILSRVIETTFLTNPRNLLRAYSRRPRIPTEVFSSPFAPPTPPKNPKRGKKVAPQPPTECCQRSCDNCVWIKYAEDMLDYYKDGGAQALKAIEAIEDPALKAFLEMEIRTRLLG